MDGFPGPATTSAASAQEAAERAVAAVWRIESARIVGALTRMVGDFGLAEDLAQEALVAALRQWPAEGVPQNPAAWLTAVAKRKAVDGWRRRERLDDRLALIAHDLEQEQAQGPELPWTRMPWTTMCCASSSSRATRSSLGRRRSR